MSENSSIKSSNQAEVIKEEIKEALEFSPQVSDSSSEDTNSLEFNEDSVHELPKRVNVIEPKRDTLVVISYPSAKNLAQPSAEKPETSERLNELDRSDTIAEEKQDELRYLKYGDRIRLRISTDPKYYLRSDGFATRRIYFQEGTGNDTSQVFRVLPKAEHSGLDSLRHDLKELTKQNGRKKDPVEETNDVLAEMEVNKEVYGRLIGQPVRYYAPIQLIHEETQQYVCISKNTILSDNEIGAKHENTELKVLLKSGITKDIMRVYSLKLFSYSSVTTHFTLIPCHKYQESGYVLEEDFFYFAYTDSKLLNKHFHLYFPLVNTNITNEKSYVAYLYDTIKSSVKYESIPDKCPDHLCRALEGKLVWITHIESPQLLCLEKLEKSTEQSENDLADLIEGGLGEAVSQSFSLGFHNYNPSQPMTANGLWIVIPRPENKNQVILRHLLYDIWLRPLTVENLVRRESQNGVLGDSSVIRLIKIGGEYISLKVNDRSRSVQMENVMTSISEYTRCFKIVQVKEEERLKYICLAQLSKFIRVYDEETLVKTYDFTKAAALFILSTVLQSLKRLCKNTLVPVYSPQLRYGVPSREIQILFREAKCIDTFKDLLLKLFPAGASEEYKSNKVAAKLLGQLLMLVSISVKNNTKNQVYTFNKAMGTIQKYIGLHLPKKQEDQALLSVVENCEEILLDLSLDQIINQFVKELAVNDFEEQMRKYEILNVLRIFCIYHEKAINETQNLLHNILFETEKGSKIFLPFKFKAGTKELIVKIYSDEEISCIDTWDNSVLKKNVLSYFRNQLFLLSDISYKNPTVLKAIKDMFPIPAVLENLRMEALDPIAKLGLAKMLISLFENTENLMFIAKPRLQQEWGVFSRGRESKFMSAAELEQLKEIIKIFFTQNLETRDTKLHCEYLRFLTYFIRCDFIFSQAEANRDWEKKFKNEYELVYRAFFFCCTYLNSVYNEDELRSSHNLVDDDRETLPQTIKTQTETKSLDSMRDAPLCLKYSMNYLHILESLAEIDKKSEDNKESSDEDSLKQEVCNFFCEINLLVQDVGLHYLKCMIKEIYEEDPDALSNESVRYVRQLFGKYSPKTDVLIPEIREYMKYKSLFKLYDDYMAESLEKVKEGDGLMRLLIGQLISSKSIQADTSILNAIIGYQLPRTEFSRSLSNMLIIAKPQIIEKHRLLSEFMVEMVNCLHQLASWPDVKDTRMLEQLKQSASHLTRWKEILSKVYDLFEEASSLERRIPFQPIEKKDARFNNLFIEKKTYALILMFLKISAKIKIEVASNILNGGNQPGLHAVTFSWELLKTIEATNKVLIEFCHNSLRSKQKMLKHIENVIIIPPPRVEDKDEKWKEYSDITRSDMDLINEITSGNINIAYLNNQQVRYFKDLVIALNSTICQYNIGKMFMIYGVF